MSFDAAAWQARSSTIKVQEVDGALTITLARPERLNALGPDMLRELLDVLDAVRRANEIKVVLLAAEGSAFCAGVDVTTPFFMESVDSTSIFEGTRLLDWQHELISTIHELPQPTIALIQGAAVGGAGLGMAMACDMRFAIGSARFWLIPHRLGVVQDYGVTWFLQRAIGVGRTIEMVYSGKVIDAHRASVIGMINQAFDDAQLMADHVSSVVSSITGMGSDPGRLLKMIVLHGTSSPLRDQLRVEAVTNGLAFTSPEFKIAKKRILDTMKPA